MAPTFDSLRVLLLQVRDRPAVAAEEQASFRERAGLRADQLLATSVLSAPLSSDLLEDVDAVLIGGAGAYSVTQTYPWTSSLVALCHTCAERALPLFGSCWGHQFIARAFGGEVVHDADRAELGTRPVDLTEAGRTDPLFQGMPPRIEVQMGHHDRVSALPEGAVELAFNATAPHQAFRLGGLPIYGTQFHSELDAARLSGRLHTYRGYYPELSEETAFLAALAGVSPTPHADRLLRTFLASFAVEPAAAEPPSL